MGQGHRGWRGQRLRPATLRSPLRRNETRRALSRGGSRRALQTKHLRAYRVVNPFPRDRHNRPCGSVPFIDQSVRLAGGAGLFEAAFILPAEIASPEEPAVGVAFAVEIRRLAGLQVERADVALMSAQEQAGSARERLGLVADVVERHPRHVLRARWPGGL